jgi:hypothetical protein
VSATLYHTGTEYLSNSLTFIRGTKADVLNVGVYHTTNPGYIPQVTDFTSVTLADGTTSTPSNLAIPGELDVVSLVGPKSGAQLTLAAGVYQRWVLVQTAAQDVIRSVDTVTVL